MNDMQSQPQDSDDESLPPGLVRDLSFLDSRPVQVPSAMDAAILSRAKADYARRLRFRPFIRWGSVAAAVAAIVTVVIVARINLVHPPRNLVRGDIDGNGTVDMLDAYILAKRVASGAKSDRAWDVNGDGVVDQNDVDWIANSAVSLDHVAMGSKTP